MNDTKEDLRRSYKCAVMDLICAKDENEQFEAKKQMLKLEQLGGQSYGIDFMDELHSLYTAKMQENEKLNKENEELFEICKSFKNDYDKLKKELDDLLYPEIFIPEIYLYEKCKANISPIDEIDLEKHMDRLLTDYCNFTRKTKLSVKKNMCLNEYLGLRNHAISDILSIKNGSGILDDIPYKVRNEGIDL